MREDLLLLAAQAGDHLLQRKLLIATAESCTGGGLSYYLTAVPGSSNWFERGFITYSNEAKIEQLGVSPETLEKSGAVSEETVKEMAEGALLNSRAHVSIAVTGIAGPDGGSPEKPVGTVWIAWGLRGQKTQAQVKIYSGGRHAVREQTIATALKELLVRLK